MFAALYGRGIGEGESGFHQQSLVDLAFTFSPLVELSVPDTVVLDIAGCGLLSGTQTNDANGNFEIESARNYAEVIMEHAAQLSFKVSIAVATNPEAAIHAARNISGLTVIPAEEELAYLGSLPINALDYSRAGIEPVRTEEIRETFALWGIHIVEDFAKLPLSGVAERLGQEGVRLQKLAQGKSERQLILVEPPRGFEQAIELEHSISELEPLSFILARLLNQLCANLHAHAQATNELRVTLKLQNRTELARIITLPVPMLNSRTFLRLLLLDIEAHPPESSIIAIKINAEPVKPRVSQTGLFIPLAPEPEKLELTLARLTKLVGADNIGSPELLDTHQPDAFRMKRFNLTDTNKKKFSNPQSAIRNPKCIMGFRVFRPPPRAKVQITSGQPTHISTHSANLSRFVRGRIVSASGPWRASGDWWRTDVWAREEWDVAIAPTNEQSNVLCRIFRDLVRDEWFVEGIYD